MPLRQVVPPTNRNVVPAWRGSSYFGPSGVKCSRSTPLGITSTTPGGMPDSM